MYTTILILHSWLRWLALVAGVVATLKALTKGDGSPSHWQGVERWGLIFLITMDLQLVFGLLLYAILSPYTAAAMNDFGLAMRDPALRFWAVEHVTSMLVAIILVHVGRVLARKTPDLAAKRQRLIICFGIAVALMLVGMPWPFMSIGRPLFRF
jgi:hypothetical protein